jgi:hypothetical protein
MYSFRIGSGGCRCRVLLTISVSGFGQILFFFTLPHLAKLTCVSLGSESQWRFRANIAKFRGESPVREFSVRDICLYLQV